MKEAAKYMTNKYPMGQDSSILEEKQVQLENKEILGRSCGGNESWNCAKE